MSDSLPSARPAKDWPARSGFLVVQLPPKELHPAACRPRIVAHRLLLGLPLSRDPRIPLGVVRPGLTRGGPAPFTRRTAPSTSRTFSMVSSRGPPQLDQRLQRGQGERPARLRQYLEGAPHQFLGREGHRGEVLPDRLVLPTRQQQHLRVLHATARAAHLLVVGDGGRGRAQVHDESEVGLVEAHAQRGRGHQCLDTVGQQIFLGLLPVGVLRAAGVRGHGVAALPEIRSHLLGGGDGQGVDDPGAGQLAEVIGQPGQPGRGIGKLKHAQAEALPIQRATQYEGVRACSRAQLLSDVRGHAGIGRRGGGEHRDSCRQVRQHRAEPSVVRAEVMAPVGDPVRLVHNQQSGGGGQLGKHLVTEIEVVEPLGATETGRAFKFQADLEP